MNQTAEPKLNLADFIDVEVLQVLQDAFAAVTGIATSIRDAEGRPITDPSVRPKFCELLQSTASGAEACRISHVDAADAALGAERPCRNECHAGLSQFVAPIMLNDARLGTIIVGDRPRRPICVQDVHRLATAHSLDADLLGRVADELEPWLDDTMTAAATFAHHLATTIAKLCHNAYQLRCRIDDLAAVHDVASKLAGRVELQEVLDTATRQLVETMGLRASGLRLLDEETGVLRIVSVCNLSPEYLDKKAIQAADSPIDQQALDGETVYVENAQTDPRTFYKDKAREEGLVSALTTPLKFRGKPIGVLRAYMDRVHAFSAFDVALMEAVASQVAAAIVNARLRRDAREADRLERQVKLAAEVQRRMIPARSPDQDRYAFGCIYEPSSDLGGDFYDFQELPTGDICVVIADVVGKGVPASLTMASARSALRTHAPRAADLNELMQEVNMRLCEDTLVGEFVTAFYCVLGADGRRLRYCNAGHEPLLLLRGGAIQRLDVGGPVLGIDPNAEYEWAETELLPGDLLVLVTDGIVEAMNYDDESYGRDRLHASIRLHGAMAPDLPTELIAKQLLWDVRRFAGLAKMSDDITLVVVRVGNPAGL